MNFSLPVVVAVAVAVYLMLVGHYRGRIDALQRNPVTQFKIVPRTLYEEQLGITWASAASPV
jgi:hypothetical protein